MNWIRRITNPHFVIRRHMSSVAASIEAKLSQAIHPLHLEVRNESYKHNVPANSETHFQVVVVSDSFVSRTLLQRHRQIHDILEEELKGPVHALSIVAKTPDQWQNLQEKGGIIEGTPNCRGGDGSLPSKV
jgi:stress-induced morphogen